MFVKGLNHVLLFFITDRIILFTIY